MSYLSTAFDAVLSLPGLRGFWPLNSFDEGGDAYDLSGHGQTLTVGDTPTFNINDLGTGYVTFDPTDYFHRPEAAHYDISGTESYVGSGKKGLTLGGWFYFSTFAGGGCQLIYKSDLILNRAYELDNITSGSAQFGFAISGDGSVIKRASMAGTLSAGQWHFIVGRFTPSTEVAIFTNKTKAVNTSSIPASIFNSSVDFKIGGPGQAAMCFLSAEAISDALLDQLYNDTLPLFDTGPDVSDTITLTETVSRRLVSLVKPTQAVTLTEAQTVRMATAGVSQNQAVTLTEAQTVSMTRQTSQAETVSLSETVSRNLLALVKPAETVTLTESVTVSMSRSLTASETVTLSEAATVNMSRQTSQGETVTLSEGVTVLRATTQVSQNETVTLTEAQTVSVATAAVSQNETVTLTEAQSVVMAVLVSQAETITLSETGTTVLLVSIVGQNETVTLSESVSVTIGTFSTLGINAAETVTVGEIVLISAGTSLLLNVSELITLSEATGASLFEIVTIVIYDTLGLTDAANSPIFNIADTLTLADSLIRPVITDTLTLTDAVTIGNVTVIVEDTLTFSEVLVLDGPTVTPPATAATSELDNRPVLKLLYGNDKRDPIRELDLAQIAPGEIRLLAGGFAPGAGERNELWSGESIRFSGSKKLAESRKNSQLAITTVLKTGGSQAALSHAQRKTNRFFTEAKQHQLLGQNHTVWLEYRWSDGLPDLATPTFGQLSNYYEVYSATAPKWPDSLHDDIMSLNQGLIDGVVLNITGSPAPEGLKQRAAIAAGAVTMADKGVLIASGASSKLHWPAYTGSGLTSTFTITGWITLNAAWGSGTKYVFDYYVSASDRISIVYDAGNNRWTITKIVGGVTFTANSATDAVANGDDVHLQLVQDATTLRLYVNGVSAASVTATATMTDGGLIALGCPGTGTLDGVDVILDGWRIMPDDITATYALALYEAELPIKEDGGQVGPPPYWFTTGGNGQLGNCDDTTRNNWGIIGGVGGDLEATTEIQLSSTHSNKYFWLGIRPQDSILTFNPFWMESQLSTFTADATASDGSYSLLSPTTSVTGSLVATDTADQGVLFGRYQLLMRVRTSGTASITTGWTFSGSLPFGNKTTVLTNAAFKVISFGDMWIQTDTEDDNNLTNLVYFSLTASVAVTFGLDFAFLLPYPFAKITQPANAISPTSFTPLVVSGGTAHVRNIAANNLGDVYEYTGGEIAAIPYKYNYLHFLQLASDETFVRTDVADIAVYITPRYLLPGGMVA